MDLDMTRRVSAWARNNDEAAGAAAAGLAVLGALAGDRLGIGALPGAITSCLIAGGVVITPAVVDTVRATRRTARRAATTARTVRAHAERMRPLEWGERRQWATDAWTARRADAIRQTMTAFGAWSRTRGDLPAGTRCDRVTMEPAGRVLHLSCRAAALYSPMLKAVDDLAAWFRTSAEVVRQPSATQVVVRFRERDPFDALDRVIPYPISADAWPIGHSVSVPYPFALSVSASPVKLRLEPGRHHRVAGTTGGGKGGVGWIELLWVLTSCDAWAYVVDFEGGVDFAPAARACRAYGVTDDQSLAVLDAFYADMMARAPGLIASGASSVTISPSCPLLHLHIDGYHRLSKAAWDKVLVIAAQCRKYGGRITMATQVPLQKAAGRSEVKYLAERLIVLPLPHREAFRAATGREPGPGELSASGDVQPGRAVLIGFGDRIDGTAKVYFVGSGRSPEDLYRRVLARVPDHPQPVRIVDQSTAIPPGNDLDGGRGEVISQPVKVVSVDTRYGEVWGKVRDLGAGGWVSQARVVEACPAARGTVRAHLAALESAGAIEVERRSGAPWFRPVSGVQVEVR